MPHILFDLDGTLIDSSTGIYSAFVAACYQVDIEPLEFNAFCGHIGPPFNTIADKLYPDISANHRRDLVSRFRLEYDAKYFKLVRWYDGVLDGLAYLASLEHFSMSIVTNKPTAPSLSIVKSVGLHSLFDFVIGVDYREARSQGNVFTTKSEAISHTISLLNCKSEDCVYIGDTSSDQLSCRDQSLKFIAVTYGFHEWTPFELRDVDSADSFADLIDLLSSFRFR